MQNDQLEVNDSDSFDFSEANIKSEETRVTGEPSTTMTDYYPKESEQNMFTPVATDNFRSFSRAPNESKGGVEDTSRNPHQCHENLGDEFYYFGMSVAAQMRKLPLINAMQMQVKIQDLLSTERCRIYESQQSSSCS